MKFNEFKYERPDVASIAKEIVELSSKIKTETDLDKAVLLVSKVQNITDEYQSMETLCSIRNSINTTDEFYEKEQEYFDENNPQIKAAVNEYNKALLSSPLRKKLEGIYGEQWFNQMEVSLKTFDEKIMSDLVEESKLVTEYSKLNASAKIEFDGKINNLSQMSVYLNSQDRNIRKSADEKVCEFRLSISKRVEEIYDNLVKVRTRMAKKLGFDNYVELGYLRLGRTDYNKDDVKSYRKQVLEEIVPIANKIVESQSKRIGIKDMKNYDTAIFYNDGNPMPKGNKDVLVGKALKMYSELSEETKEFFTHMVESDVMDLESKPGKAGGGYCTFIPKYKTPFIFSNFNGTMGDVDVLTHEAGHAFEVYTASKLLPISDVYWPTLEACEIHSMSMEFFAHPWMDLFFEGDAAKYRFKHLAESITFIPYGVSVDEYQHFVYENPEASIDDRNNKWREIEAKYTPWKKYENEYYLNGKTWQRQAHIFSNAFYYIDYTLAQVCAFQYLVKDSINHVDAWNNYLSLCKQGGSKAFTKLLEAVGLKNPFKAGSLKEIMPTVEEILNKLENNVK